MAMYLQIVLLIGFYSSFGFSYKARASCVMTAVVLVAMVVDSVNKNVQYRCVTSFSVEWLFVCAHVPLFACRLTFPNLIQSFSSFQLEAIQQRKTNKRKKLNKRTFLTSILFTSSHPFTTSNVMLPVADTTQGSRRLDLPNHPLKN